MTVRLIGWDRRSTVALVDGVRVRVRRSVNRARWLCDSHGTGTTPHCAHLEALADMPAPDRNAITRERNCS